MMQFLDVEHSYYCSESNYHSNDMNGDFESWEEFLQEYGDADEDFNLLFRWDVLPRYEDDELEDGQRILMLFFMQQRRGAFAPVTVKVNESDEPGIIEYLKPKWEHMKQLWMPFPEMPLSGE
jgi:hypothetical protein